MISPSNTINTYRASEIYSTFTSYCENFHYMPVPLASFRILANKVLYDEYEATRIELDGRYLKGKFSLETFPTSATMPALNDDSE